MQYRNTNDNYGVIAKTLHWLTAFLFLGSYATVYYRRWFTDEGTAENWDILQLHLSIGVSVGVLVLLRIFWRLTNKVPEEESGAKLQHQAAKVGHLALYGVMIVMPVTGYLGTAAATEYFGLFEISKFPDTRLYTQIIQPALGVEFDAFEKPIDFLHKDILGAWLVWILIIGHAAAALSHHYLKNDRTLKKMTSGRP